MEQVVQIDDVWLALFLGLWESLHSKRDPAHKVTQRNQTDVLNRREDARLNHQIRVFLHRGFEAWHVAVETSFNHLSVLH